MPCATLAVSIAILTHPGAPSEALFAKDVAGTSRALRRVRVSPFGDIAFDDYKGCVTARFALHKSEGFRFAPQPFEAARSNTAPFAVPGADDPDFHGQNAAYAERGAAEADVFKIDWVSRVRGRASVRPYRLSLTGPDHAAIVIDPKIGNTGVCLNSTIVGGHYRVDC